MPTAEERARFNETLNRFKEEHPDDNVMIFDAGEELHRTSSVQRDRHVELEDERAHDDLQDVLDAGDDADPPPEQ